MLQLISADLDRLQDIQVYLSRPIVFCEALELNVPQPMELVGNAFTILERPILDLAFPTAPRALTGAERQMLDRAFWSSVTVIHEGEEG
jgi:hypothetical protein